MTKVSSQQIEIGQRLRILRHALHLSQEELGKQLAVSGCYLSMVENGLRQPSEHLLRLLCLTQNVNRQWLERGAGEMLCQAKKGSSLTQRAWQPYNRSLMKIAINLVAQAVNEMEQPFSVDEHSELVLNCYERLLREDGYTG